MGKKYAPAFANIFMHYWEQQAYYMFGSRSGHASVFTGASQSHNHYLPYK